MKLKGVSTKVPTPPPRVKIEGEAPVKVDHGAKAVELLKAGGHKSADEALASAHHALETARDYIKGSSDDTPTERAVGLLFGTAGFAVFSPVLLGIMTVHAVTGTVAGLPDYAKAGVHGMMRGIEMLRGGAS